jgi:hypothetical protein
VRVWQLHILAVTSSKTGTSAQSNAKPHRVSYQELYGTYCTALSSSPSFAITYALRTEKQGGRGYPSTFAMLSPIIRVK